MQTRLAVTCVLSCELCPAYFSLSAGAMPVFALERNGAGRGGSTNRRHAPGETARALSISLRGDKSWIPAIVLQYDVTVSQAQAQLAARVVVVVVVVVPGQRSIDRTGSAQCALTSTLHAATLAKIVASPAQLTRHRLLHRLTLLCKREWCRQQKGLH